MNVERISLADLAARRARALAAAGMVKGDDAPVSAEHDRFLAEAYASVAAAPEVVEDRYATGTFDASLAEQD